ncbi:hypothetical protein RhiTH_005600 [Rhizoctonia solani]
MSKLGKSPLSKSQASSLASLAKLSTLSKKWKKSEEAGVEARTNLENISQAVDTVKDGLRSLQLHGPRTPEDTKPPAVEATPRPLSKIDPVGSTSWVSFWPKPSKGLPAFAQPTPVQAVPLRVPSPPPSPRLRSPIGTAAPSPPAPVTAYPAPVKVDHPNAYTGKIGSEAKQWLTQMLAWTRLNLRMFPTNQEVLSFLLMNMKDTAGAWAHPHLDQLGSHRAIIQTVEGFKLEFLAAFGDPDATRGRGAENYHPHPVRHMRGLYYKVQDLGDGTGLERRGPSRPVCPVASIGRSAAKLLPANTAPVPLPRAAKCSTYHLTPQGTSTGQSSTGSKKLSNNPNFVSEEEQSRRRAAGACIKCGKMGHKFAECHTGWKATPIEDKGKAKGKPPKLAKTPSTNREKKKQAEHLEVLIDSGATSSFLHPRTAEALRLPLIDLPMPRTATMLNGLSPPGWKDLEEGSSNLPN